MASTGRGKQSFRDFTRTANELKRSILSALKSGEQYTIDEIGAWYDEIIGEYENTITDEDIPNGELWISRTNDTAERHKEEIETLYPIVGIDRGINDEDDSGEDSGEDENPDEPDSISGIPVISEHECISNGNNARGQILLTFEELIEYLEPIPPSVIQGLIPVFRDGVLIGYRLCAARET